MSHNPAVLLYDQNGNAQAVQDDTIIPAQTSGLMLAAHDHNTNKSRFLRTDHTGNLSIVPSQYSKTAFGEVRTANQFTMANLINRYFIDSRQYGTSVNSGGAVTHLPNMSAIQLSVPSTSGAYAKLRTHTYYRYQAGKGLRVTQTGFSADAGQTNQIKHWGLFDDYDGIIWELNGTELRLIRRTSTSGSVVDNIIDRATWNEDKMDGTGPSGITLDVTKGNIYEIQIQWLGVGSVWCYVDGHQVHEIKNANLHAAPYMKTATLPLSWEVSNTAASTASSYTFVCAKVAIEGGEDQPQTTFGAYNSSDIAVGTTDRPLLSMRPTQLLNAIENRAVLVPHVANINTDGARAAFRIVMDGALTGATWNPVATDSAAEFDTASTAISGGDTLFRGFLPNTTDARTVDISGFFSEFGRVMRRFAFGSGANILTITGQNLKAGTTQMSASVAWHEVY